MTPTPRSMTTSLALLTLALCAGCSPSERNFAAGAGGAVGGAGQGGAGAGGGAGGQGEACSSPEDCPAAEHQTATCEAGRCGVACDDGFLDCDAAAPGCETSASAHEHCGACGTRCATACAAGDEGAFCNDPVEISAGFAHTCALRRDGSVWCWGRNTFGESGRSESEPVVPLPAQVPLPGKALHVAAGGGNSSATELGVNPAHTCAILEDTTVTCWGSGTVGQLGDNGFHPASAPVWVNGLIDVVQLSLGAAHSCAVKTGDELYCWGADDQGQLGNGSDVMQTVYPEPVLIRSDVRRVAAGQEHTCAIRASDGGLLCWGRNSDGQLGIGSQDDVHSPVDVDPPLGAGVDEVAAGDRHTCARKGVEVHCFGNDANGAVGIGYFEPVPVPKLVVLPQALHIGAGLERSGAVTGEARRLAMWGAPHLGDGSSMRSPQPVYADIDGVAQLAVGHHHTCALKTTGEVLCWGYNNEGQLGVGLDVAEQPSPVAVRLAPP
ncbi:hypothetical protein [Sorangium sp. So ce385]|uniref:RCC1 domain-containing protein n=1 Tax=Sorangium sp. So ce385 TaxID=3133308 RepID=UPI003F5B7C75